MGSMKKGQQLWMQIIMRQNIKMYHSHKTGKHINFYEASVEFIETMLAPYIRTVKNDKDGDGPMDLRQMVGMPDFLKPAVTAVTENMQLVHFDVGIRVVCLSKKDLISEDEFNNLRRDVRLIFRQFAQPGINEMLRVNATQFDAPWSDPTGLAMTKMKKRMLDYYRLRIMFHPPIQYAFDYPSVLSIFFPAYKPNICVMSNRSSLRYFTFRVWYQRLHHSSVLSQRLQNHLQIFLFNYEFNVISQKNIRRKTITKFNYSRNCFSCYAGDFCTH